MLKCSRNRCEKGICCVECERGKELNGCACDIAENLLQDRDLISELCKSAVKEEVKE